ncbi:MAG: hypothetical protein WBN69_08525 [Eudoraea sp.]
MRGIFLGIFLVAACIFYSSCRKDFEYESSNGELQFSKDTVYLDTVFTNISSSTYSIKVYNNSNSDIEIPNIRLAQGETSGYRLNVDGLAGRTFTNIPLLAKDSLFIFIETTFDINTVGVNEFLYTDAILFDQGDLEQKVELVTLVKDAIFLFPSTDTDGTKETIFIGVDADGQEINVEGFILKDDQLTFTKEKPYVIYGYAGIAPERRLIIDAGVRVHFHKNSGLIVGDGGSIEINGLQSNDTLLLENEVIFEGDRLEPELSDIPGQWGGILLSKGSFANSIDHLTIKNATRGLSVEGDKQVSNSNLLIKNSRIYNSTINNLLAKSANISAENLVLGNAGDGSMLCEVGGHYRFLHSTIANYWSNGFRTRAALQISNQDTFNPGSNVSHDLTAEFINCIVEGNSFKELDLRDNEQNLFAFSFTNCLIKFRDFEEVDTINPLYDFDNPEYYRDIILNQAPDFINTSNEDFRIGENSSAINNALPEGALEVPFDIIGIDRTTEPDIGAFEAKLAN